MSEMPNPTPRQRFWYWVSGYDKPLPTLISALRVIGLNYASITWEQLPMNVKSLIRKERIEEEGDAD